ncbi:MAG: acetyl-CoA synthetase, partial [Verrucomicrobiota bacterium]
MGNATHTLRIAKRLQKRGVRSSSCRFSIERGGEIASLSFAMAENIESHLVEKRVFKPAKTFAKGSRIKSLEQYRRMYRESINRPEKFWAREASELVWQRRWKSVLKWKPPFAQWFAGGKLNVSENCLD